MKHIKSINELFNWGKKKKEFNLGDIPNLDNFGDDQVFTIKFVFNHEEDLSIKSTILREEIKHIDVSPSKSCMHIRNYISNVIFSIKNDKNFLCDSMMTLMSDYSSQHQRWNDTFEIYFRLNISEMNEFLENIQRIGKGLNI